MALKLGQLLKGAGQNNMNNFLEKYKRKLQHKQLPFEYDEYEDVDWFGDKFWKYAMIFVWLGVAYFIIKIIIDLWIKN